MSYKLVIAIILIIFLILLLLVMWYLINKNKRNVNDEVILLKQINRKISLIPLENVLKKIKNFSKSDDYLINKFQSIKKDYHNLKTKKIKIFQSISNLDDDLETITAKDAKRQTKKIKRELEMFSIKIDNLVIKAGNLLTSDNLISKEFLYQKNTYQKINREYSLKKMHLIWFKEWIDNTSNKILLSIKKYNDSYKAGNHNTCKSEISKINKLNVEFAHEVNELPFIEIVILKQIPLTIDSINRKKEKLNQKLKNDFFLNINYDKKITKIKSDYKNIKANIKNMTRDEMKQLIKNIYIKIEEINFLMKEELAALQLYNNLKSDFKNAIIKLLNEYKFFHSIFTKLLNNKWIKRNLENKYNTLKKDFKNINATIVNFNKFNKDSSINFLIKVNKMKSILQYIANFTNSINSFILDLNTLVNEINTIKNQKKLINKILVYLKFSILNKKIILNDYDNSIINELNDRIIKIDNSLSMDIDFVEIQKLINDNVELVDETIKNLYAKVKCSKILDSFILELNPYRITKANIDSIIKIAENKCMTGHYFNALEHILDNLNKNKGRKNV